MLLGFLQASCFPGFVLPSGYAEWVRMEEADTSFSLSEYVYLQLPTPALDRFVNGEVLGVIHEQLALVETWWKHWHFLVPRCRGRSHAAHA